VMALGLPIVSTNVGGIPFLMDHEQDSTLVEPDNEEEMYKAILQLLQEPGLAKAYSLNERKKAEQMDWAHVSKGWNKILS